MILIIMDFNSQKIYTKTIKKNLNSEKIESKIIKLGFNLDEVHYMTSPDFEHKDLDTI